jgi:hypothetical protein
MTLNFSLTNKYVVWFLLAQISTKPKHTLLYAKKTSVPVPVY